MYDPIGGLEAIKQFYLSYLETAFRIDNPAVAAARRALLESHGTLALDPILELVPRYERSKHSLEDLVGRQGDAILKSMSRESRVAFIELVLSGLFDGDAAAPGGPTRYVGRFKPYEHQIEMLRRGLLDGVPGIVTSGTGSGKTESFLLPLIASIVKEVEHWPDGVRSGNRWFEQHGGQFVPQRQQEHPSRRKAVRAMILYPMNALVEDQMVRLRKALDSDAARETMRLRLRGNSIYFARYTGGTPVTGFERHPRLADDPAWIKRHKQRRDELMKYLKSLSRTQGAVRQSDDEKRQVNPKASPDRFLFPSIDGNELVDRWDIQATPPDVLVTNYSMLNAILVREVDAPILDETRAWLAERDEARFHLVMDELHLVRGSGGAETAGLLRVLLSRLGLDDPARRHKLRVLASSASLPVDESAGGEASLRFLWDMFGTAGTFAGAAVSGAKEPVDWKQAVVGGAPVPFEVPSGRPDAATLADVADALDGGPPGASLKGSIEKAVCTLAGVDEISKAAVETAVQKAAGHLASACGGHREHLGMMAQDLFGSPDIPALRGLTVLRALPDLPKGVIDEACEPDPSALVGAPSFRIHSFFRSIEGLFASVGRGATRPEWGTPSVERGEAFEGGSADGKRRRRFEMLYCESCGELFAGGRRGGGANAHTVFLLPSPQDLERLPELAGSGRFEESSYADYSLFWPTAAGSAGDDPIYLWRPAHLDPYSGAITQAEGEETVPGFLLCRDHQNKQDRHKRNARGPSTAVPYCCPRCGTDYSPRFIAKNTLRREGRLSPIRSFRAGFGKTSQLLASELASTLRGQGGDGKLVAFSDSRQDAASLALNIEVQHQRDLHRELLIDAVYQSVKNQAPDVAGLEAMRAHRKQLDQVDYDSKDHEAIAALTSRIKALEAKNNAANHAPSVALSDLLEFERGALADGRLRPVLERLVAMGANPAVGPDHGKLAFQDWHTFFDVRTKPYRWRSGMGEQELNNLRKAREQILGEQRPDATDLLFNRTYFAIEETGLGWPSFFSREAYGPAESRKDAWLRVFADAYRILPNRFMDEKDAKAWDDYGDLARSKRVAVLLGRLCANPAREADEFLRWLAADGRAHADGKIEVAQLFFRPTSPDGQFWRCENCSRVHLHRGFDKCTRCGRDLGTAPDGTVADLRAQNYLGARFERSRRRNEAPFRLRCEELTGQTNEPGARLRRFKGISVKAQDEDEASHGLRAKADEIDFVSVTTTMEVGVDIGALEAVYQANMPPQRFNYQQRVGRAGRRGQAFAAVVTVCRSRSHDLHYFRNPLRITGDRPPPPFLTTGLVDVPSRLLRKFWLSHAFEHLRVTTAGPWAGDLVRPPDIHGEFVYCSAFFDVADDWPVRIRAALAATGAIRMAYSETLAQAAGIDQAVLLQAVSINSVLDDIEGLRDEFQDQHVGLASAMAEQGLIPLYGLPTRTRNLYVGLKNGQGFGLPPDWDTVDRDADVALYEFAPGSVLVRDKRRHLSIGFTGVLPPPSSNPNDDVVKPYGDGWSRGVHYLGACSACGSWEKDQLGTRACRACGADIPTTSYKRCVSPAGYRTDFVPKDDDLASTGRHEVTVGSVGAQDEVQIRNIGNLRLLFEERAQIHKVNTGPFTSEGDAPGFTIEDKVDLRAASIRPPKGGKARWIRLVDQAVVPSLVDPMLPRFVAPDDGGAVETAWLSSTKVTNSLQVSPVATSPLLRIAEVDVGTFIQGRRPELTSVRAAAVSATQLLVLRAALDMDVAPEEFEALSPRAVGHGTSARPFLQIADALVNGSGFCRQLQQGGEQAIDALIASVLDGSNWPLPVFLDTEHRRKCDQACYGCLQRYGNRSLHGLLDWRLGVSYLRALADPTFVCGLDDCFDDFGELRDWRAWAARYVDDVSAYLPGVKTKTFSALKLPSFGIDATRWAVVVHPLWRKEGLRERLGLDDRFGFIDTFELARRPLAAVERLRGQVDAD